MAVRILQGDCRDVLRTLADESVDSIVTDPPYELNPEYVAIAKRRIHGDAPLLAEVESA